MDTGKRGGMGGLEKAPEFCSVTAFVETRITSLSSDLAGRMRWVGLNFHLHHPSENRAGERKSQSFTHFQWAGLDLGPEHLRL